MTEDLNKVQMVYISEDATLRLRRGMREAFRYLLISPEVPVEFRFLADSAAALLLEIDENPSRLIAEMERLERRCEYLRGEIDLIQKEPS